MAAPCRKFKQEKIFSFSFVFEGGLQSCVRADLTNELVKYLLYERQQFPYPYDQMKHELKSRTHRLNADNNKKPPHNKPQPPHNRLQMKKIEDALQKLEETVRQVKHAFELCPEIKQVAVVLGATPVSPKEIYVFHFPPLSPEADNLTSKESVKSLFRQLITQDPLGHVKSIPITNLAVLLNAPRHSTFSWFLPKSGYKIPQRGNQFHFNLFSNIAYHGSQDLSKDFSVIDLSGFEPFESSVMDSPMSEVRSSNSDCSGSLSAEYVHIDSDHDIEIVDECESEDVTPKNLTIDSLTSNSTCDQSLEERDLRNSDTDGGIHSLNDHDYIWFQSPIVVKGFKQKSSKQLNSNDLF